MYGKIKYKLFGSKSLGNKIKYHGVVNQSAYRWNHVDHSNARLSLFSHQLAPDASTVGSVPGSRWDLFRFQMLR